MVAAVTEAAVTEAAVTVRALALARLSERMRQEHVCQLHVRVRNSERLIKLREIFGIFWTCLTVSAIAQPK